MKIINKNINDFSCDIRSVGNANTFPGALRSGVKICQVTLVEVEPAFPLFSRKFRHAGNCSSSNLTIVKVKFAYFIIIC